MAFGNPSFIKGKDKDLGPRKRRTHLVDKGADKVDEADLQLGEFVRLVSVHHGLSRGRQSSRHWLLLAACGQGPHATYEVFLPKDKIPNLKLIKFPDLTSRLQEIQG